MEVIGFVVGVVGLMLALFAEVKRREASDALASGRPARTSRLTP